MASIMDDKAVLFALDMIKLSKKLKVTHDYEISSQVIRAGTSIGANIREAQAAQSKRDFVHKLSISLKEAREIRFWLELLVKSEMMDQSTYNILDGKALELIRMLTSSIKTTKQKYDLKYDS